MSELADPTRPMAGDLHHNVVVVLSTTPMVYDAKDFTAQFKTGMKVLDWFSNLVYFMTWPDNPKKIPIHDKESAKKWLAARRAICEHVKKLRHMTNEIILNSNAVSVSDDELRAAVIVTKRALPGESHTTGLAISDEAFSAVEGEIVEP